MKSGKAIYNPVDDVTSPAINLQDQTDSSVENYGNIHTGKLQMLHSNPKNMAMTAFGSTEREVELSYQAA
jgi:hypothetical protein